MKIINTFILSTIFLLTSLISVNAESTLDKVMKTGILKVGTTGDFPGWSFRVILNFFFLEIFKCLKWINLI